MMEFQKLRHHVPRDNVLTMPMLKHSLIDVQLITLFQPSPANISQTQLNALLYLLPVDHTLLVPSPNLYVMKLGLLGPLAHNSS